MKHAWTLDQLGSQVAQALKWGYEPAASGRVRAVPDRRTIRYYTTLGLVDRPSELRGRTAYYGRRHLLQLVAIKRLQGEGLSLREVQERLVGLDERSLSEIADLPARVAGSEQGAEQVESEQGAEPSLASGVGGPSGAAEQGRADFWSARPPLAEPAAALAPPTAPALPLRALGLAPGVSLVLPGGVELSAVDRSVLARAAEPLLRELERMGILPSGDSSLGEDPSLGGQMGAAGGADGSAE